MRSKSCLCTLVILSCMIVLAGAPETHATTFAVLLSSSSPSCDVDLGPSSDANRPSSLFVELPLSALDTDKLVTIEYDLTIPPNVLRPDGGYVFTLTVKNPSTGNEITTFDAPLIIQLEYPENSPQADPAGKVLSYLDEDLSPPQWKTQDKALTNKAGKSSGNQYLCGKTDHLTTFFMGDAQGVPEPGTVLLLTCCMPLLRARFFR